MLAMDKNIISCHELTIVLNGNIQYEVNSIKYELDEGDAIYVPKGATRSRLALQNVDYVSLNFSTETENNFPTKIKNGASDVVHLLIQAFDGIYKYTTNLTDQRFEKLLDCLILQIQTQLTIQSENPFVARIKKYIKQNLSKKLNLSKIAEQIYLSPVYCETLFKKETGKSIIDYLIEERINRAKNMLWDGGMPLKKIAIAVGFSDYNYFCRTFKKRTGYSPLQYRKNLRTSDLIYNVNH
jgi:YesN/AraC family two-component response regulator